MTNWAEVGVYNEAGFQIASTEHVNLVLYNKYLLPIVGGVVAPGFPGFYDAYALLPPDDGGTIRFYKARGQTVEQGDKVRINPVYVGETIECYSFGPLIPDNAKYGLELYDDQGNRTFGTARPFLRLRAVHVDPRNYMLDFQTGNASYPPEDLGIGPGNYAWTTGNSRYFYRMTQFVGDGGAPFTDEWESILAVGVNVNGVYNNLALQFGGVRRTSGYNGYGNHVPQTGPITILVADVEGL